MWECMMWLCSSSGGNAEATNSSGSLQMCLCPRNLADADAAAWHLLQPCPCIFHSMSDLGASGYLVVLQQSVLAERWGEPRRLPAIFLNLSFVFSCWDQHAVILHTHPLSSSLHLAEEHFIWLRPCWCHRSPSGKPTASGHLLNLSLFRGRMSQNKGYLKTAIERRNPPASRLCAPVLGWWAGWSSSLGSWWGCHKELHPSIHSSTCQGCCPLITPLQ